MALLRRSRRSAPADEISGPARPGRRTKDLTKLLAPGDIAIIKHQDLDRVAAEGLIGAQVAAVVNASPSISGRYPNGGPIRIVQAGIPLFDSDDPDVLEKIADGEGVRIDRMGLWKGEELVTQGVLLDEGSIVRAMDDARATIGGELEQFARNTLEYVTREADDTFAPVVLPPLSANFKNRHALVVVRGHDYKEDLRALRPYIREYRPVLIAVDGGADAILDNGFTPDVIIGDFDSVSEKALHCGADLIHHVHRDGRAPGRENLVDFGVEYDEFVMNGTSEDVAMVLAYEAGATLIVAVGTHATMVEFLDKGRPGMSSTFLTRLRLGPVLVDAKGVSRLYEGRVRRLDIFLLVGSALVAMIAISIVSPPIHVFLNALRLTFRDLWDSITGAF